jgi:glyoxylase-like metal-dependent hydrolase (beta-lactamase superfamily II)
MGKELGSFGVVQLTGFELGPFATNAYVLENGSDCVVIDCPYEPDALLEYLHSRKLVPSQLILTHAHCDHIGGLTAFRKAFPACRVLIHAAEAEFLSRPELNLSAFFGQPLSLPAADGLLQGGGSIALAGAEWTILHTPGHSPGSISLYAPSLGIAIVGDTLFAGSIGRTDFPNSDFDTLAASIRSELYTLPEVTRIFPGHGPESSVGKEKRSNSFVRA